MVKLFCVIIFLFYFVDQFYGHILRAGRCPVVQPVVPFYADRFLGAWYITEKTDSSSPCQMYTINSHVDNKKFYLHHSSMLSQNEYKYEYYIELEEKDMPGRMKYTKDAPISISQTLTVVSTDYYNYAAVYLCQNLAVMHRESIMLLSRNRYMPDLYRISALTALENVGLELEKLEQIDQSVCRPANMLYQMDIRGTFPTFSP